MATIKVGKPSIAKAPKVSVPKPKQPKAMSMTTKAPKSSSSSMNAYKNSSKVQNGLKGAISKSGLASLNASDLSQL